MRGFSCGRTVVIVHICKTGSHQNQSSGRVIASDSQRSCQIFTRPCSHVVLLEGVRSRAVVDKTPEQHVCMRFWGGKEDGDEEKEDEDISMSLLQDLRPTCVYQLDPSGGSSLPSSAVKMSNGEEN
jgi:hypothetical protein